MVGLVQQLVVYTTHDLLSSYPFSESELPAFYKPSTAKMTCSQPFWGNVVASNGAGPVPIPHKALNHQNLADAITFCLTPEAQQAARAVADQMRRENGVNTAVQSFHRQLDARQLRCD